MRMHSENRTNPFIFITLLKILDKNLERKGTRLSPLLGIFYPIP
jgi:hypothetical protein